jgi:methylated-DNA-[protein]-cysteine S-methyltransferase
MTAAARDEALVGLWFVGQKYYPAQRADWICASDHPILMATDHYLARYFAGEAGLLDVRLAPSGSPFQETVWALLSRIPMGHIATYGQIAHYIARTRGLASMSAQAVGGAIGRNPISILIPCHRVVGSDGSLTGYAGGLDRKAALLRIENASLAVKKHGRAMIFR